MITFNPRFGIGFDIEHNENIIHLVGETDDQDDAKPAAFIGLIIKVPFLSCYIGDFYELEV